MRFRHRARQKTLAGLTTLLLPLAALVGLASPASAAGSATATYTKTQDWGTGFGGQWTVKNTGTTALSSWTIQWDFPSGTSVTSAWDADVTNSGTHWTAKNKSYNGTLAAGASVTFGFNGAGSGSPPTAPSTAAVVTEGPPSPATTRPRRPAPPPPPPSPTPR